MPLASSEPHTVSGAMQIFLQSPINGKPHLVIEVDPSATMITFKKILKRRGVSLSPKDYLHTNAKILDLNSKTTTLGDYKIKRGQRLRIGRDFLAEPSYVDKIGYKYLSATNVEDVDMVALEEALGQKAKYLGTDNFSAYSFEKRCTLLSAAQLGRLRDFLDFLCNKERNEGNLRWILSEQAFLLLLEPLDADGKEEINASSAYRTLSQLFHRVPGAAGANGPVILLEQISRETKCVDFHCEDGENATSTTQIALNDPTEYEGGRLVYFHCDELRVLNRPTGSIVQHSAKVLHGVTALISGTRQSLFVVDKTNKWGYWGAYHLDGVNDVGMEDLNDFFESKRPKVADCVICMVRPADHVLSPCGHLCLCDGCVSKIKGICPKCRVRVAFKTKVFL